MMMSFHVVPCLFVVLVVMMVVGVSQAQDYFAPKPCTGAMPTVTVDPTKFSGTWYRMATTINRNQLTGYRLTVTHQGAGTFEITSKKYYQGSNSCEDVVWHCQLTGAVCTALDLPFPFVVNFNFIDYDSYFVVYNEATVPQGIIPTFDIYAKNPRTFSPSDLSSIQSELVTFCGSDVLDPSSTFYTNSGKVSSYTDLPADACIFD